MGTVSRPLIALLVGTVALFAVWTVALSPGSSSSGGSTHGQSFAQSALAKAHHAVGTADRAAVAQGAENAGGTGSPAGGTGSPAGGTGSPRSAAAAPAPATVSTTAATATHPPSTSATATHAPSTAAPRSHPVLRLQHAAPATRSRLSAVNAALAAKRVVALLFYNPAGADDRAVEHELSLVPVHGHRVVRLAVPLSELGLYTVVTSQVPVNQSPTLVVIDRTLHASTIVGFADHFEIAQRVMDALAVR